MLAGVGSAKRKVASDEELMVKVDLLHRPFLEAFQIILPADYVRMTSRSLLTLR